MASWQRFGLGERLVSLTAMRDGGRIGAGMESQSNPPFAGLPIDAEWTGWLQRRCPVTVSVICARNPSACSLWAPQAISQVYGGGPRMSSNNWLGASMAWGSSGTQ